MLLKLGLKTDGWKDGWWMGAQTKGGVNRWIDGFWLELPGQEDDQGEGSEVQWWISGAKCLIKISRLKHCGINQEPES